MPELTDDFIREKFAHLYEQYFAKFEIRTDGEGKRFIHAEHDHPRFKRTFVPLMFCGIRVNCVPADAPAKA